MWEVTLTLALLLSMLPTLLILFLGTVCQTCYNSVLVDEEMTREYNFTGIDQEEVSRPTLKPCKFYDFSTFTFHLVYHHTSFSLWQVTQWVLDGLVEQKYIVPPHFVVEGKDPGLLSRIENTSRRHQRKMSGFPYLWSTGFLTGWVNLYKSNDSHKTVVKVYCYIVKRRPYTNICWDWESM